MIAQIIPILAAPFIARLFNAEEFGEYAAILAVIQITSVAVNGRYELAIVLPKNDEDAKAILKGNFLIGVLVSLLVALFLVFFSNQISSIIDFELEFKHIILIFIALLGLMIWQPINFLFIRSKAFLKMTYTKFAKSITLVVLTLLFGYYKDLFELNGLLLGFSICWFLVGLYSLYLSKVSIFRNSKLSLSRIRKNLALYSSYPKFNLLPSVVNSLSAQLGLYLFIYLYSTEIAGHFSFSKQYLYGPLSILGVSLGQVFFQRISEKCKNNISVKKELGLLLLFLVGVGAIFSAIIMLFSVPLFDLVFGAKWNDAAIMSKVLIVAFAFQFVVSPLSNVLHALNRVKLASVFPFVYMFCLGALFLMPKLELHKFLPIYVAAEFVPYLIYLALIFYAVFEYEKKLSKRVIEE